MCVRFMFLLGLLGLCACAEPPQRHLERVHKQQQKTHAQAYAEGYRDGCASAYHLGGDGRYTYQKDAIRTQQDALYSKGWRAGQQQCQIQAAEKQQAEERFHNRLFHRGKKAAAHQPPVQHTEEEQAIWESLKK